MNSLHFNKPKTIFFQSKPKQGGKTPGKGGRYDMACLGKCDIARVSLAKDPACSRKQLMTVCFEKGPSGWKACNKIIEVCIRKNEKVVKVCNACFKTYSCFAH